MLPFRDTDDMWMDQAMKQARLATCDRARVGCVIVGWGEVLGQGFNTAPHGATCDEVGHLMWEGHCARASHAELRAIISMNGRRSTLLTLYTTHYPCIGCAHAIVSVRGINRIVYREMYGNNPATQALFISANIQVDQWKGVGHGCR